jgi:hypothetical protein
MDLIADILLIAGTCAAALYCIVLSRRLKRFNDLEKGVGGAIAVLSAQVDDMTKTLAAAQKTALGSNESLEGLTERAEGVAQRLELLVASMHDLPGGETPPPEPEKTATEETDGGLGGFRSARGENAKEAA